MLDGHSDQPLGEADMRFMSLLGMRVSAEIHREYLIRELLGQERKAAQEKQRFVTAVIHDLRQPLATARTLLHVAHSESDLGEKRSCLDLLDQRLVAICRVVDELMEYSHVSTGDNPWRSELVNVETLLLQQLADFQFEADTLGIAVTSEIDANLGSLDTDPVRLGHIVHNLLSNALKFTALAPEGGRKVALRARPIRRSHWELEVHDTGIGMSPSFLRRAFEEGSRAPGTSVIEDSIGYPRGKGIGLAIAKGLCAAAGAEVRVRSRRGQGSRFTIRFPRSPAKGASKWV